MNETMSTTDDDTTDPMTDEDIVLDTLQACKMLPNASYFAFTATPKNKTLEIFGVR